MSRLSIRVGRDDGAPIAGKMVARGTSHPSSQPVLKHNSYFGNTNSCIIKCIYSNSIINVIDKIRFITVLAFEALHNR